MSWLKKNKKAGVVYEIVGRERGILEARLEFIQAANNAIVGQLKNIVEREQIPAGSVFDEKFLRFVEAPAQPSAQVPVASPQV